MKRKLNLIFILASLLLSVNIVRAQSPVAPWVGEWSGTLEIYNSKGLTQTVTMGLNIAPLTDSTWTWQIVYGEGEGKQVRNYELIPNGAPGQYLVDEKNSIKLDLNLIHNGLFSFFQVGDSKLLISYEIMGDKLYFRTHSMNAKTKTETGGGDQAPLVYSWKTGAYQIAVLTKK